jgi:hypothetical protein
MDQPPRGGRGERTVATDSEPLGQRFTVGRSPLGEGQREHLVVRSGLYHGRWSRAVSDSPGGQQHPPGVECVIQRRGHRTGRPTLAVLDVPHVAAVDVRPPGKLSEGEPGTVTPPAQLRRELSPSVAVHVSPRVVYLVSPQLCRH